MFRSQLHGLPDNTWGKLSSLTWKENQLKKLINKIKFWAGELKVRRHCVFLGQMFTLKPLQSSPPLNTPNHSVPPEYFLNHLNTPLLQNLWSTAESPCTPKNLRTPLLLSITQKPLNTPPFPKVILPQDSPKNPLNTSTPRNPLKTIPSQYSQNLLQWNP